MSGSGLLKKLANLISPSKGRDPYGYWLYVRCKRCGEKISTRVDLRNDLSPEYGEDEQDTIYYCRKVLMGQKLCFQKIEVHIKFSEKREILDREISGGVFISREEFYEAREEGASWK